MLERSIKASQQKYRGILEMHTINLQSVLHILESISISRKGTCTGTTTETTWEIYLFLCAATCEHGHFCKATQKSASG